MKRINAALFFAILISLFLTVSCGDDDNSTDPTPNGDKEYIPMFQGNYWISEVYELDTNGRISETPYFDSLTVTGTETKLGKTAYIFEGFISQERINWEKNRTEYYYVENGKIYTHSDIFQSIFRINLEEVDFEIPIEFPDEWYLLADPGKDSWHIDTIGVDSTAIDIMGFKGYIEATVYINGLKEGTEQITYKGIDYTAHKYSVEFKFDGVANGALPIKFTRYFNIWFIEGIGFYKTKNEAFTIPLVNYQVPGFERILIFDFVQNNQTD